MQLPSSSAQEFGNKLRRMGGTPTQPQSTAAVKPSGGMTPWGQQMQGGNDRSGGRGGFGQPNPQAMQGRTFNSPWSLGNQSPKMAGQLAAGNSPFPGFEPQTGGPNFQFQRLHLSDIIPPGPPGGSYGPVENRPPYIPPGPAGQSYGPFEGFGGQQLPLPANAPVQQFGGGPYNPEAKPGQITGAYVDPITGQQMFMPTGKGPGGFIPPGPAGQSYGGGYLVNGIPAPSSFNAIPPGPAGQSYGPVEGGKPPVDRSWLRTEGLRRPQIQDEYDVW